MKKVSIIVPVYNVEKYLAKCLDSLVNQTFKDIEILVINDGSPDNSQTIIDEYQKKYPDLITCYKKENGGQASARNLGIKKAKGEYITFVDSDDYVDVHIIEKLYNKIVKDNADIAVCDAYEVINDNISALDSFKSHNEDTNKRYIADCTGSCWCQLIKRSLITNNELYFLENHVYEDIAVIPAFCLFAKKITFLDENLYYYLIRSGSTMKQETYSKKLEDIFDALDYLHERFRKQKSSNTYYTELEYIYIEHLLHAASLRFFKFEKYDQLDKIIDIMKKEFPNWNKNKYYKMHDYKYRIVCSLLFRKKYKILKLILKG